PAGPWRSQIRRRWRRANDAMEVRLEQLAAARRGRVSTQRQDGAARWIRPLFREPHRAVVDERVQYVDVAHQFAGWRPDADIRSRQPLPERHRAAARQLARPAHISRTGAEFLESELRRPVRASV